MNKKTLKYTGMVVIALAFSACATQPDPAPITQKQQVEKVAPLAPAYTPPKQIKPVVRQAEDNLAEAVPEAPKAGTKEHFKYMAGEDRVYFGYDRYDLTPQTRDVLRRQAQWLKEYSSSILVVGGNADERGTREYNLALGARRADAVKAFIVAQGIAPGRITTVSYGKERPIDGGSNEAAWALNRNAHSAVLVGGTS